MGNYKTIIEESELEEGLTHKIMISGDERMLYLLVECKEEYNLTIERMFNNNSVDLERLSNTAKDLNTIDKVLRYLKIGSPRDE